MSPSPDNPGYPQSYRGQVVTLSRLEDGTHTIEVALNNPAPVGTEITLGTVVEVQVRGHVLGGDQLLLFAP